MKFSVFIIIIAVLFNLNGFTQNDTSVIKLFSQKILVFDENHQEDSVLVYAEKCLALSKKINYEIGIAKAFSRMGVVYMHKGNYPDALNCFFKALPIYEKLNYKVGVLIQYGNIGIVFDNQNDNVKALDYYFKALKISESINDKLHASIQYCNIAIVYSKSNDLQKTKNYFLKALEIDKELNDKEGIARNLNNIGSVSFDLNDYSEALSYYKEALPISKEIGDNYQIAGCLVNMANTYYALKQNKKAENLFIQSLNTVEDVDDLDLKSQIELTVSEFYTNIKNDKEALVHYKRHILLRDSVYNEDNTKKSMKVEMTYSFDKKQIATKFEHDKVVYKLELENKLHSQQRIFLILFIIVALVLLFFAKRAYDNKKKIAEFMASESNRKEVLLQEVHHRINNNLQIISSLLTLQANSADDEKLTAYLKQSQNRIQSLSVLHELLYQSDSPLQINMNDYLNKVLEFHRDVLTTLTAKVEVKMQVTDAVFPTKMAVPLALIVNELATNAIKYAFKDVDNGKIVVSLEQIEGKEWLLKVSDSGKGLPDDTNFRKDSLGLRLVTIMTKQLNATLTKYNKDGAIFELRFIA